MSVTNLKLYMLLKSGGLAPVLVKQQKYCTAQHLLGVRIRMANEIVVAEFWPFSIAKSLWQQILHYHRMHRTLASHEYLSCQPCNVKQVYCSVL